MNTFTKSSHYHLFRTSRFHHQTFYEIICSWKSTYSNTTSCFNKVLFASYFFKKIYGRLYIICTSTRSRRSVCDRVATQWLCRIQPLDDRLCFLLPLMISSSSLFYFYILILFYEKHSTTLLYINNTYTTNLL